MRGRSYSYSPSPPRGYGRRGRSPSPRARGRYAGHGRDLPTSLLVRNLRHDCRPEDLRRPFGQFGPVKDIYLPRDYYTGEPRGFGFIQYCESSDAIEAKYQMDGQIFFGRELTVVFAEENRKKPVDMRARERRGRRQSPLCYSPSPRSPPRHYTRSPLRNRDYSRSISPRRRDLSFSPRGRDHHHRSASPESKQYGRERSRHRRERSYSPQASPAYSRSRSRSRA